MSTFKPPLLPILTELRHGLEELSESEGSTGAANLSARKWTSDGYVPILLDLLAGHGTVERSLAELVERHALDVEDDVFLRVVSTRLEELALAAQRDSDRALLWSRVSVALMRHCVAVRAGGSRTTRAVQSRGDKPTARLTGISHAARELRLRAAHAARGQGNLLITGETGVGKERVVQAIHAMCPRRDQPLVTVNCAAIAPGLVDSELFGHRKGAFTGANRDYQGMFRAADKGVLFLDEIAEMPLESQAKLLRALEQRVVRPVGDVREYPVDVRVISATNQDVEAAVADGRLRQDLYYRLRVHHLTVPPLRARADDIPLLVAEFIAQIEAKGLRVPRHPTDAEMNVFVRYPWPGNIRQLRACVEEWADGAGAAGFVLPTDLQRWRAEHGKFPDAEPQEPIESLDAHVAEYVRRAVEAEDGNRARAAEVLGISRSRLYRMLDHIEPGGLPEARRGRPKKN